MKILHIVDTLKAEKGGVSQAVHTMASEIAKAGIMNEVVTLDVHDGSAPKELFQVSRLGPSKSAWSYSKNLIPWLQQNLGKFDTIIVHGLWLYQTFAIRKALRMYLRENTPEMRRPSLYIMPHGMLDPYFQRASQRKLKAFRNWLYWKVIESKVVNFADGLLFTCKEECVLAAVPFSPYRPKRELVIGLGVAEPPIFESFMKDDFRKICPEVRNKKYLLYLGRIDKKKGVDLLIKAYHKLISEPDSMPVLAKENAFTNSSLSEGGSTQSAFPMLVIAGPGLELAYGKKLVDLVRASPLLRDKIIFPGMLMGEAKWGAFYGAEAFILPSHQENFGIAVVEALACSKPVLISKQVNICLEIKQEHAGIVDEDSEAGTYQLLNSWRKLSEVQRLQMEKQAKKCYEKHFALDAATSRLLNAVSYRTQR
jgi:glycosyltransferase involved in cell wall biosynthesis